MNHWLCSILLKSPSFKIQPKCRNGAVEISYLCLVIVMSLYFTGKACFISVFGYDFIDPGDASTDFET